MAHYSQWRSISSAKEYADLERQISPNIYILYITKSKVEESKCFLEEPFANEGSYSGLLVAVKCIHNMNPPPSPLLTGLVFFNYWASISCYNFFSFYSFLYLRLLLLNGLNISQVLLIKVLFIKETFNIVFKPSKNVEITLPDEFIFVFILYFSRAILFEKSC